MIPFFVGCVAVILFVMAALVAVKFYFPVVERVRLSPFRAFMDDFLSYIVLGCLLIVAVVV